MGKCVVWILVASVSALLAVGLHRVAVPTGLPVYLGYGLGYAVFSAVLLIVLRQCRPGWHPAMQRMVSLLAGAGLAALDVSVSGLSGEPGQQAFFSALLGVALVQVVAKFFVKKP